MATIHVFSPHFLTGFLSGPVYRVQRLGILSIIDAGVRPGNKLRIGFHSTDVSSSHSRNGVQKYSARNSVSVLYEKARIQPEGDLRVAVLFGGNSVERGISINSARSLLDHLQGDGISVQTYYFDQNLNVYSVPTSRMYSNTPQDFDFKLSRIAGRFNSTEEFLDHLKRTTDIVFPAIHGKFGEGGDIQSLLEGRNIPFVGTGSESASQAFDKGVAFQLLSAFGFATIPQFLFTSDSSQDELQQWFISCCVDSLAGLVVVKPARAGSSIGVTVAAGASEAFLEAGKILLQGLDSRVVVERYAEGGSEFTLTLLGGGAAPPLALIPTQVEIVRGGEEADKQDGIFSYRRKYLPTQQVRYHSPPLFPNSAVSTIRECASLLYQKLGLQDFARIDGWVFLDADAPTNVVESFNDQRQPLVGRFEGGTVVFSDINIVSGMEQTSFLFQQAAQAGLTHSGVLHSILGHACARQGVPFLPAVPGAPASLSGRQRVWVLCGGGSSERQVSLMSGVNAWLKLASFADFEVEPFLLSPENVGRAGSRTVWPIPYATALRHTVEEVELGCMEAMASDHSPGCHVQQLLEETKQLFPELLPRDRVRNSLNAPTKCDLQEWLDRAKSEKAVIFLAVHGDIGEDGTIQALLEEQRIPFTGSGSLASRVCIDKFVTGQRIHHLAPHGIYSVEKRQLSLASASSLSGQEVSALWASLTSALSSQFLCVKPTSDGCSTGVAKLSCSNDLAVYLAAVCSGKQRLLPGDLSSMESIVELPCPPPLHLLFERFVHTDPVVPLPSAQSEAVQWQGLSRWVEVTVGLLQRSSGAAGLTALTPSITVKGSPGVLTLEEKFQGGTGINLTPPPESIISPAALRQCRQRVEKVGHALGLQGFARIDAFVHADTGEIIVIEVNTVPGMTPSTVLFHQALEEVPPVAPRDFFRAVVEGALRV